MTKGTSASRRGLGHAATRVAYSHRQRQSAAARAASIFDGGHQKEDARAGSSLRHISDAAATIEQLPPRVSAISPHESSADRPFGPKVRKGQESSYVDKDRYLRSYGSLNGPKRPQGERCTRSYGRRHGYRKGEGRVRSYGQRRVFSYGARQGYSYGEGDRRLRLYGRERGRIVRSGHSETGKRFGKWFNASDSELMSSSAGALWVAGNFLNTFARNLNFSNLPGIVKLKYQLAGNEYKNLSQAQGVWESIPAQVRAGGPDALSKFHQGKNWSHIIAKSRGGPSTADNAIWWSSEKNRALGAKTMSLADIADARAVLRSDAIRAAVTQTASGMAKGAIMAVVVGGALACLECGLDYAEGRITRREMAQRVVHASVKGGGGALFTTGIIVGISLLFPFLIPILTPVLLVLQGASFVLMGARGIKLAKGWWAVLEGQQLPVHFSFGEAVKAIPMRAKNLPAMANGNIIRSGSAIKSSVQELSVGKTGKFFPRRPNRGQERNQYDSSPEAG